MINCGKECPIMKSMICCADCKRDDCSCSCTVKKESETCQYGTKIEDKE